MYIYTVFTRVKVDPVYKPTPQKNKFFLFQGKNFLEKLIFYLRIFFQVHYGYMKKNCPEFFLSQFLTHL